MRTTAKWIVAATAGAGAVLLGGAPLVAAGKVHGAGHAAQAFVGLALALLGVGWVIWRISDALIPPTTSLRMLEAGADVSRLRRKVRDQMREESEALFGSFGGSLESLRRRNRAFRVAAANLAVKRAGEQDVEKQLRLDHDISVATARAESARQRLQYVLELAHAWTVREQLRRARLHAFAGAAAAAAGAVLFIAAAHS
jgi:hypothetical protein